MRHILAEFFGTVCRRSACSRRRHPERTCRARRTVRLALAIMAGSTPSADISGGHFNPAVTLRPSSSRGGSNRRSLGVYWVSQFLGGIAARSRFARPHSQDDVDLDSDVPVLNGIGSRRGASCSRRSDLPPRHGDPSVLEAALVPGSALSIAGLRSASRSRSPCTSRRCPSAARREPRAGARAGADANVWDHIWIYFVGPGLGAALAALLYDWLYLRPAAARAGRHAGVRRARTASRRRRGRLGRREQDDRTAPAGAVRPESRATGRRSSCRACCDTPRRLEAHRSRTPARS